MARLEGQHAMMTQPGHPESACLSHTPPPQVRESEACSLVLLSSCAESSCTLPGMIVDVSSWQRANHPLERNGALLRVRTEVRSKTCLTPPTLLEM